MCRAPWHSCIMKIGEPGTSFCTWMKPRVSLSRPQTLPKPRSSPGATDSVLETGPLRVPCAFSDYKAHGVHRNRTKCYDFGRQRAALQVLLLLHHPNPLATSTSKEPRKIPRHGQTGMSFRHSAPPSEALIITGKPMDSLFSFACSTVLTVPWRKMSCNASWGRLGLEISDFHRRSSGMVPSGPKFACRPSPLHGMDGTPAVWAKMLALV